jgi:hypothetical protein
MVLTVSFVLSPVTGLFCHRHQRKTARLDASVGASGPHDFAVRIGTVRQTARRVHRIPLRVDDVAQRPSEELDVRTNALDLPDVESEIFFVERLDREMNEQTS